jgi:hypothetical protein
MDDHDTLFASPAKRDKPPPRPKRVSSIRSKLQAERRTRDLAMDSFLARNFAVGIQDAIEGGSDMQRTQGIGRS